MAHYTDTWTKEDWRAYAEERAAIAEYDGGLSRAAAEKLASDTIWRLQAEASRTRRS